MTFDDLKYLTNNFATLCGIPTRLYKGKETVYTSSLVTFSKDPIILYIDEILSHKEHIGYITTEDFFNYTYLNYNSYTLIVGPFRMIKADEQILAKLALDINLTKDEMPDFYIAMNSISNMPLEIVLQSLSMLNFVLNGERKNVSEITIDIEKTNELNKELNTQAEEEKIDKVGDDVPYENNTYAIENELYRIVEHGEVDELLMWIKNAPAVRPGVMSKDIIRQTKNTFIASATLISRAAIKGMLDINEALSLSDLYIQKMELMQSISEIYSLQMNMVLDYTQRVAKINGKKNASSFLVNLNKYIIAHLSDAIKTDDICDALFISKSSLFEKVKKETGMTVSEYILNIKVNESKSLLKYTDKSIASISLYLGFSSSSHFNHAFKKFTNTTPLEYRKTHK